MLLERAGAPGVAGASGVEAVVRHLWESKRPCSFKRPEDAVVILGTYDRVGAFVRAVLEGRATREEAFGFHRELAPADREQWLRYLEGADALRKGVLSLVLQRLDSGTSGMLVSLWGVLADDVWQLIAQRLDTGDITLATWCLQEVSPALSGDAKDQFLAHLLALGSQRSQQRQSALLALLSKQQVPAAGTFPASRAVLRYGGLDGWQALLVRELLAGLVGQKRGRDRAECFAGINPPHLLQCSCRHPNYQRRPG